jgi:hypothetical protein
VYQAGKRRSQETASQIAKTLLRLKETLPKNKEEWGQVVKNPKHPFTAALLTGFLILLMELSGFGIYVIMAWILGNLVLNPFGWVLIPLTVAIVLTYRSYFKRDRLDKLKKQIKELEIKRDTGEITSEEFENRKNKLLADFFD